MSIIEKPAPKEGGVSLQYPMLTSSNYSVWAIKIEVFMDAQGVWEAIEPTEGVVVEKRKDKMALACIFQAVSEEILLQLAKHKTAKEAWESLKIMNLGADRVKKARTQTLRSDFEALRMKESETVDEFAGKITSLANQIHSLGEQVEEAMLVKKLIQ